MWVWLTYLYLPICAIYGVRGIENYQPTIFAGRIPTQREFSREFDLHGVILITAAQSVFSRCPVHPVDELMYFDRNLLRQVVNFTTLKRTSFAISSLQSPPLWNWGNIVA